MKKITGTEFRSDFGFSSPNFSVDSSGNLTASSITTQSDSNTTDVDIKIFDDENGVVFIEDREGIYPSFSVAKTKTTVIEIDLDIVELFFLKENKQDFLDQGIRHNSGDSGSDAQGKSSGLYFLNLPADYSENTIFYTDRSQTFFGEISVIDPVGIFSTVEITGDADSETPLQGALTVSGGLGVGKSISVGETVETPSVITSDISSEDNLNINITNRISILGSDSSIVGIIDDAGTDLPIKDTSIDTSTINNSSIGLTTPSSAKFSEAEVLADPERNNDITNKSYVDTQDIAFSIAFGL